MNVVALFPELISTTGNSHRILKMTKDTNALLRNNITGYGYELSEYQIGNKI
jgi:hypothetical protein